MSNENGDASQDSHPVRRAIRTRRRSRLQHRGVRDGWSFPLTGAFEMGDPFVDAYGEQERAMGRCYYLQGQIRFPFTATCIAKRATSPLKLDDEVKVIGMPGEDECEHEMFVKVRWEKKGLAVPLLQLKPTAATNKQTHQAVEDWRYWVKMGYQF